MVEHLKLVLDVIDRQGLSLARPPLPAALVGRGAGHEARPGVLHHPRRYRAGASASVVM